MRETAMAMDRESRIAARVEMAVLLSGPKRFELLREAAKQAYAKAVDLAAWMMYDSDVVDAAERRTALKAMEEVGTHLNRATMALTDAERSGYFD